MTRSTSSLLADQGRPSREQMVSLVSGESHRRSSGRLGVSVLDPSAAQDAPTAWLAVEPERWLCDGMSSDTATQVLARGLDQLEPLLHSVRDEDLGRLTPCSDWTVSDLVDHVVTTPS